MIVSTTIPHMARMTKLLKTMIQRLIALARLRGSVLKRPSNEGSPYLRMAAYWRDTVNNLLKRVYTFVRQPIPVTESYARQELLLPCRVVRREHQLRRR